MHTRTTIAGLALLGALSIVPAAICQDRDGDRNRFGRDRITRIEPGANISVRTNDGIDVERFNNRVYFGVVDQDVRGQNGRMAIPRGSRVELTVRVMRDNDLVLDLESVNVNGERYAIQADKNRVESQRDNSLVGSIVGAISGGQVQGRAVRVPRDTVLNFRIQTPLVLGVADRGVDRDGYHYHELDHAEEGRNGDSVGDLRIISASWGAQARRGDVTRILAQRIRDGRLHVDASNQEMGFDPAQGVVKALTVVYEIRGRRQEVHIPEGGFLDLP